MEKVLTQSAGHLRALKVAIAAARSCIGASIPEPGNMRMMLTRHAETDQMPVGLQILAAGAGRLEALKESAEPVAPLELNSLTVEHYSLRTRIVRSSGNIHR